MWMHKPHRVMPFLADWVPIGSCHNSWAGIFLCREQRNAHKGQGLQTLSFSWLWVLSFFLSPWRAMCGWLGFFQLTTPEIWLKIVKFGKQHWSLSMHFGQIVICSSLFSLVKDKLASVPCSSIEDVSILIRFPKIGYIACVHLFSYTSPIFICFL